jgi:flagellar M-ring protein FliF
MPSRRGLSAVEEKPSASVVLNLRRELSRSQVEAIRYMIGASVEGMTASDVVVIDSQGNLLAGEKDTLGGMGDKRLELQSQVENYLAQKAQKMLDLALGTGNSSVKDYSRA